MSVQELLKRFQWGDWAPANTWPKMSGTYHVQVRDNDGVIHDEVLAWDGRRFAKGNASVPLFAVLGWRPALGAAAVARLKRSA